MPRRQKPPRLYLRKDESVWIILDAGKHIRTGCRADEREQANEVFREYLNSKALPQHQNLNSSQITLGQILSQYAEDVGPDHKDPARTAYAIKALATYWGDLSPNDISIKRSRDYEKLRNRSLWTVRRELGVLQAALNHAEVALGLVNPPRIKLPKKPAPRTRWLTQNEFSTLLGHAPPHLERFLLISVLTGRRKKAVLGLGWESSTSHGWIDLEMGIIHFKGTDETESKKQRGSITMPKPLWDSAREWHQDGKAAVIHYHGKKVADIDSSFERACREANLVDVVPHTLKHTAVTWAFQGGMSLEDAVDYFATSAATLEAVYRQNSPMHQDRPVTIMSQIGVDIIANNVADRASGTDNTI